jgi:succinate dehydrogenase / fumarate reductase cytochrome b subunit
MQFCIVINQHTPRIVEYLTFVVLPKYSCLNSSRMLNLDTIARKLKDKSVRDRPVNLNLFTIKFPITAIVSILHRISGVILFLLIPFFLALLQNSLYVPETFETINLQITDSVFTKVGLWIGLSALFYHLLAGIRHLCMDVGFGEQIIIARASSYLVFILAFAISIALGIYLC